MRSQTCEQTRARKTLSRCGVRVGALGVVLGDLPEADLEQIILEAARRGKTIAEVLVEDWEPL